MIHLVLGGARSGKSSFAERSVLNSSEHNQLPVYIATAQPLDSEMKQRIMRHQQLRNEQSWQLIECPVALHQLLPRMSGEQKVLVDCMTLWLSNQLTLGLETAQCQSQDIDKLTGEQSAKLDCFLHQQVGELGTALGQVTADVTLVSNEIGLGVVPVGQATRLFVDHQGWMNQKLAQLADKVTLVTAGIPLTIKETAHG